MYTQWIDIFNETYSDHIVVFVTDNFQFQFFPAENGFFYQNLSYQAGLKTSGTYGFQFLFIINKTAAGAAHGIGRTKNDRVSEFICNSQCLIYTVSNFTPCHFNAKFIHCFFEFNTVFSSFDGVYLYADYFDIIFIQNACFI